MNKEICDFRFAILPEAEKFYEEASELTAITSASRISALEHS
jgi:hypothetical protein